MKGIIAFSITALVGVSTFAQFDVSGGPINNPSPNVIDGVYIKSNIPTKRLVPYEHVREADVIWETRVWRTIDLREKINHSLYYPFDEIDANYNWVKHATRWSLWTVIKTHVLKGDLIAYSPVNPIDNFVTDGDAFKYPITPPAGKNFYNDEEFKDRLFFYFGSLGLQSDDPLKDQYGDDSIGADGNFVYPDRDTTWFMTQDIIQYKLKEDWFFDKERSVLDVRIMGICPVIYRKSPDGVIEGVRELFWLYFPQCRFVFNNYFAYNANNDAMWFSFDDIFWKRQFNSTVIKASNVFDRNIETYKNGIDALYESQRITEHIRNIEHDVWDF